MNTSNISSVKKTKPQVFTWIVGLLLLIPSLYFIIHALHFFKLDPNDLGKYLSLKWLLLLHIAAGSVTLLTGPFQFWEQFRNRNLKLHRQLGKAYVIAVAMSGLCAAVLSCTTAYEVGGSYAFSLQVWVSVWLVSTAMAYRTARQKKFKLHKEWMVRSYIVTLAFVVSALLLKLPFIAALGSFSDVSPGLFWVSWAVPLFVYDIYLSNQVKR